MPGTFKSWRMTGWEHCVCHEFFYRGAFPVRASLREFFGGSAPGDRFSGAAGGDVTTAAGATGLPGAGPRATEGAGVNVGAGNVGSAGAGSGGGIALVASTAGLSDAGLSGGIDGIGSSRRRAGIFRRFLHGRIDLDVGIRFRARRRFLAAFWLGGRNPRSFRFPRARRLLRWELGGNDFPRRGTPRGSRQIHFTVPLPPSVRIKFFLSRRGNSSMTHRFEKPVSLASTSNLIWRRARLGASALGAGINWINTRYNIASASGMAFSSQFEVNLRGYVTGPGPEHLFRPGPAGCRPWGVLQIDLVVRHLTVDADLCAAAGRRVSAAAPLAPARGQGDGMAAHASSPSRSFVGAASSRSTR